MTQIESEPVGSNAKILESYDLIVSSEKWAIGFRNLPTKGVVVFGQLPSAGELHKTLSDTLTNSGLLQTLVLSLLELEQIAEKRKHYTESTCL